MRSLLPSANGWTYNRYRVFRILLGLYLLFHFLFLLPWGVELFSSVGVIPDASHSPLFYAFPNILAFWDSPVLIQGSLGAGVVAAALLCIGKYDRMSAFFLWYLLACLLSRNPLIANPSLPYVGWLLLAHCLIPKQTPSNWKMPQSIFVVAWVVLAVGYSYSGITKLWSPSWIDGTALTHVLDNPLARPTFLRDWLLALPPTILAGMTWAALAGEAFFLPLTLVPRLRPALWWAMVAMHLSLILLIDFAELSVGMILFHLFTYPFPPEEAFVPNSA